MSPGLNDYPTTRPTVNNRLSTEEFLEQHRKTWNPDKVIEPTTPPTSAPIPVKPSGKPFDNGRPYPTPTPPKWSISGNSATASAKAEAQRGADRNRNEVPSCFPNCPTPVPTIPLPTATPVPTATPAEELTPEEVEIANNAIATWIAENTTPTPTVVWKTYSGTHAGIKANEAIALVKDYLWRKPYPGDNRVYQDETCGWIWDRDYPVQTTWKADRHLDSAWLVIANNSSNLEWLTGGWLVYPAFGSIVQWGTILDYDQSNLKKRC